MEYDEFGNPLFEEELSDDEEESQGSVASPTRLQEDQQPLRDFDEDDHQGAMEVDGQSLHFLLYLSIHEGRDWREIHWMVEAISLLLNKQRGEGGYTRELSILKRAK